MPHTDSKGRGVGYRVPDMLNCVELNVDLSKCWTRTGHNVIWSRQQGQMSGE